MSGRSDRFDVVIAGSGFAGSILARLLARAGRRVLLVERASHPRFAVGESSTPLAAIALERLAARYDLPDLASLAAYGRWSRDLAGPGRSLKRGLKRGFTFLAHRPGQALAPDASGRWRLLVAASPDDRVADSHWLRADVDAHLAGRAAAEGVEVRERTELAVEELGAGACRLQASPERGEPYEVRASFLVDATGAAGLVAKAVGRPQAAPRLDSALLFSHFDRVAPLDVLGPLGPEGPYPDERAAVHHLLEEGWMYALRFDDGRVSAGIELLGAAAREARAALGGAGAADREEALRRIVRRYPTLAAQYGEARALRPVAFVPRLQRRLARAAGPSWLLLPHAFAFSTPLFSTGIAWSLLGVERAARLLEAGEAPEAASLERYSRLLALEAGWVERLAAGAFAAMSAAEPGDLGAFGPWSLLYFAAASWSEARQRLLPEERADSGAWCWEPFLGAGDPGLEEIVVQAEERLRQILAGGAPRAFDAWVRSAIPPRDVAGLGRGDRGGLYPVDLEDLVAAHDVLGLTEDEVRRALPRLRGAAAEPEEVGR
jgi:FADH2 O2-dependent halogenase